jgi:hypothetical protein
MKNLINFKKTFNFKKIIKFILILIIILLVLEIISKTIVYFSHGHLKKPSDVVRGDNLNSYVQLLEKQTKCTYKDSLFPHPYLGWVHWNNPKCLKTLVFNSDGFYGPEFPIKKDNNFFDILITGGSVSGQFGPGSKCSGNNQSVFCRDFLGEALSQYVSVDDKKIRIFNAGAGAYKHPHQSIVSTLFGNSFDLIISIEGFNEHYMLRGKYPKKFYIPPGNFNVATNGFYVDNGFSKLYLDFMFFYKNLANTSYLVNNSHFHSLSYRILKVIAEKTILKENDKRKNYSNLWRYKKSELETLDIEKFKYQNLVSMWKNFIATSGSNGAKGIVIIHPVPKLYKTLSEVEKEVTKHREYNDIFLKMSKEAEKLRLNENLMVYDLFRIFENYQDTIYTDHSHMNGDGYLIMANEIRKILVTNNIVKEKIN